MIRDKKMVIILISALLVGLLSFVVAFAAMSTSINITFGDVNQSALTWDIGLQSGTITGVANQSGLSCGTATATTTQISGVAPVFHAVGDMCSYTFHILNNGTIPGKISAINITGPSGVSCSKSGSTMTCGSIEYKLHYDTSTSTSLVAVGNVIAAKSGSTATDKTVVLTITYLSSVTPSTFSGQTFSYSITYAQN